MILVISATGISIYKQINNNKLPVLLIIFHAWNFQVCTVVENEN